MFISVQSGGDSRPEVLDAPPVGQNQPMGEVARREVDWAVRRWRGEGVDSIARQAGVAPTVVRHAIAWVAPLTGTKASTSAAEAALWVQLRQMGHSTASVAGYFGVTAATVRRHTGQFGPFPRWTASTISRWVQQRRDRVAVEQIARAEQVPARAVREATKPFGPFKLPRHHAELLCLEDVRALVGMSSPSVSRWRDTGILPPPEEIRSGRWLWRPETINSWLDECGHETCPQCGARPRSMSRHVSHTHREWLQGSDLEAARRRQG